MAGQLIAARGQISSQILHPVQLPVKQNDLISPFSSLSSSAQQGQLSQH
jgi:hypothetical protein